MIESRLLVCLCFLLVVGTFDSAAFAKDSPNVVLIVADDLGYSDLGCYGGEIETPNLDRLAASGLRLTRFYNTGRCCPSRASILSGQYPHRVDLGHMTTGSLDRDGYRGRFSADAVTIAQVLEGNRYRSFISGKWHLGTDDPTQHGFEEFYGTLVSAKRFFDPDHFIRLPADRQKRVYPPGEFYGTDAVTDHAIDFVRQAQQTPDKPWFLYLAYNAPHFPLHAKKQDIQKYVDHYHVGWDELRQSRLDRMKRLGVVPPNTKLSPRSRYWDYGEVNTGVNPAWKSIEQDRRLDLARRMAIYAAMVDSMDQNIGRLIQHLKQTNQFENTLLVFLSDNGACAEWDPWGFDIRSSPNNILHRADQIDAMGEPGTFHSAGSGWANVSNTPFRLYKHFNHEGGILSPCIVHWPAGIKPSMQGKLNSTPTHIIDLLPTITDVTGTPYKGAHELAGESLRPLFKGQSIESRDLFFEHESNRAVTDGRFKAVAVKDEPWELYDLQNDPTELNDLAVSNAPKLNELVAKWERWAADHNVTPLPKDYKVRYLKPSR